MARTFDVLAVAVTPSTGEHLAEPRVERIDTDNPIFAEASGPWDVEDRYHAFWNRLNDSWEHDFPPYKEKVLVLQVTEVYP